VELSISVEGVEEARFMLTRFGDAALNLREPLTRIDEQIRGIFTAQFKSEGEARSGGWKPLAEATKRTRLRADPMDPLGILIRTSRLYRGATNTGNPRDTVRRIMPGELRSGTRVPYAIYHHSKAPRRGKLPRRPLIELTIQDVTGFAKIIQAHIVYQARGY
jgi:hypothetical protein